LPTIRRRRQFKATQKTQSRMPSAEGASTKVLEAIRWIVQQAITGIGPFDSAHDLADEFKRKYNQPEDAIEALIRSEMVKAGTSGFLMGLPGLLALPLTIPANMGADYLLGARMVAAIAKLRGWDLQDDKVQTFVVLCLLGHHGKQVVKSVSEVVAVKAAQSMVSNLSGKILAQVERKVGSKIVSQVFEHGASSILRALPLAGGVIGASIDASYLFITSKAAKKVFTPKYR
jgi:hypothetical protein